jgi:hypothetical protein
MGVDRQVELNQGRRNHNNRMNQDRVRRHKERGVGMNEDRIDVSKRDVSSTMHSDVGVELTGEVEGDERLP